MKIIISCSPITMQCWFFSCHSFLIFCTQTASKHKTNLNGGHVPNLHSSALSDRGLKPQFTHMFSLSHTHTHTHTLSLACTQTLHDLAFEFPFRCWFHSSARWEGNGYDHTEGCVGFPFSGSFTQRRLQWGSPFNFFANLLKIGDPPVFVCVGADLYPVFPSVVAL